jgi:DNA topoisomerase-1
MESAEFERTTIDIAAQGNDAQRYTFRANGTVVRFDGFLRLYQEGRDDEADEDSKRLPAMARGDRLGVERILSSQHFTEPPPRYSEASLIKKLEELGIGRPSTYTAILVVLRERGYVRVDKKRLVPEDKGRLVTAFLEAFFRRYVEYDFTANLEEQLDRISAGEIEWKSVLRDFWRDFIAAVDEIKDLRVSAVLDALNDLLGPHIFPPREDGAPPRQCPSCGTGQLSLKLGRFGAFIGCSNYPECRFTRQLSNGEDGDREGVPAEGIELGTDPGTGQPVTLHSGRFGPYVQRARPDDEKPDRTSLPKGVTPEQVDFDFALKLLELPREVGLHPETGKPITAGLGRYGPFVQHDGKFANLDNFEEIFTVGLNRAVDVLASKQARGGRAGPAVLRDLGPHPQGGGSLQVMSGRYGPYIKYDNVNATLPRDVSPESVTLDQAVALVADKQAKGKPARKAPARKATPKKAAAKAKAPAKTKAKAPANRAPAKSKAKAKARAKSAAKS